MLAKCANPICGAHFRYLSQGRVFNVPLYGTESENGTDTTAKRYAYPQRVEHYWMCARCLMTLTLVTRKGIVGVRPRFPQLTAGSPTSPPKTISAAA